MGPDLNRAMIEHHRCHPHPILRCEVCEALWLFDQAGDRLDKALRNWSRKMRAS